MWKVGGFGDFVVYQHQYITSKNVPSSIDAPEPQTKAVLGN